MTAPSTIQPSQCLVVVPAMNEEKTIGAVVSAICAQGFEALVVDDGSNDNTYSIAEKAGAILLPLAFNIGAWNATQAGIRYAIKHNYDYVITMDADGQHSAESLKVLLAAAQESDVVIGSYTQRGSLGRKMAWTFFKKIAGFNFDDLTSGFRLYNKQAMLVIASRKATLLEYQDVGVLLLITQSQLSIAEIETKMVSRTDGKSRIFSSWRKVIYYMLYTSLLSISKLKPIKRLKPQTS